MLPQNTAPKLSDLFGHKDVNGSEDFDNTQ